MSTPPLRHQALHTVLDVLEALAAGRTGVSEIARELGAAKSGVHKILANLETRGYVRAGPDHEYYLGLKLWELGVSAVSELNLREAALPHMQALTDRTGEGTLLSVYDRGEVVYLEKTTSPRPVTATTRVGGRAPAFCTATGKAILAWQTREEIDRVLTLPLESFNEATVTNPTEIIEDLETVRQRGFALNLGQWRGEIYGVAAPIRDYTDEVVAALGLSGPAFRFGSGGIEAVAPDVIATANKISAQLGWSG